jgi:hypothetical protein
VTYWKPARTSLRRTVCRVSDAGRGRTIS